MGEPPPRSANLAHGHTRYLADLPNSQNPVSNYHFCPSRIQSPSSKRSSHGQVQKISQVPSPQKVQSPHPPQTFQSPPPRPVGPLPPLSLCRSLGKSLRPMAKIHR